MIVSTLILTDNRMEVVEFSYPFSLEEMTFVTSKPEYVPNVYAFWELFSTDIWILIILNIFIQSFITYFFSNNRYSPAKIVLSTLGILLRQDLQQEPQETKDYFLLTNWLLGAMFLSSFYSAVLLSFLSFPPLKGVKTISELSSAVSKGECWCATYPGGCIADILLRSTDPSLQIIGKSLTENPGSNDINYIFESPTPQKPVFIGGSTHFRQLKQSYYVSGDIFFSAIILVVLRTNFCCEAKLNEAIYFIWASGHIGKISSDVEFRIELMKRKTITPSGETTERQLTVSDFESAFIFLMISQVLALFVFLTEVLISRVKPRSSFRKHKD